MNLSALAERIQTIRTTDVTDTGAGLIVRDSRTPYLKLYIRPTGQCRSRWEYPQPDRRGRIPGLTAADAATVARMPRRTVDLGAFRLPDDLSAATDTVRRHLDRQAFQIVPHRLHHPAPQPKVLQTYRHLIDDLLDPDVPDNDPLVVRGRALLASALATPAGPNLIAAFVDDEVERLTERRQPRHMPSIRIRYEGHDRSAVRNAAALLAASRTVLSAADPRRLDVMLTTLLDLVNRVPDRVLAANRMSRVEYAPALALIAWWSQQVPRS